MGNFIKVLARRESYSHVFSNFAHEKKATYAALGLTYSFLTPDLWKKQAIPRHPFSEYSAFFETQKQKK